jgi:hypothetical protein
VGGRGWLPLFDSASRRLRLALAHLSAVLLKGVSMNAGDDLFPRADRTPGSGDVAQREASHELVE